MQDLKRLRMVGMIEGISYLLLLLIAMPLKYMAGWPWGVKVVGWAHGILFVLYLGLALQCTLKYKWPFRRLIEAFLAAILPAGPFVWDRWLKKEEARLQAA